MDLSDDRLGKSLQNSRFHFIEGDIAINREWIEYHVKKCDIVMPLVAIATPKLYVEDPIGVYNLDFEMNLNVIKQCVNTTNGWCSLPPRRSTAHAPIRNSRRMRAISWSGRSRRSDGSTPAASSFWTGSFTLTAPGDTSEFTLFRPFNWVGPRLDSLYTAKEGSSRVVTQFIAELLMKRPISLVDGGSQKRCFTYVDDGIGALLRILENANDAAKTRSSTSAIRTTNAPYGSWPTS